MSTQPTIGAAIQEGREARRKEIGKIVWDAVAKAAGVDWKLDTPETRAAEHDLNEAMAQYVDDTTSKANVRSVYQRWRDLHKTGVTTSV